VEKKGGSAKRPKRGRMVQLVGRGTYGWRTSRNVSINGRGPSTLLLVKARRVLSLGISTLGTSNLSRKPGVAGKQVNREPGLQSRHAAPAAPLDPFLWLNGDGGIIGRRSRRCAEKAIRPVLRSRRRRPQLRARSRRSRRPRRVRAQGSRASIPLGCRPGGRGCPSRCGRRRRTIRLRRTGRARAPPRTKSWKRRIVADTRNSLCPNRCARQVGHGGAGRVPGPSQGRQGRLKVVERLHCWQRRRRRSPPRPCLLPLGCRAEIRQTPETILLLDQAHAPVCSRNDRRGRVSMRPVACARHKGGVWLNGDRL
jgi:hypothetical protein